MSRYIDVNMLIKKYIDTDIKKFSNSDVKIVLENLKQNILKAPTIEPKRGEWIKKQHRVPLPWDCEPYYGDESYDESDHSVIEEWWHCNRCDYEADRLTKPNYNFCPNCGADMRKETVDYKNIILTCDDKGNWLMDGERKESE